MEKLLKAEDYATYFEYRKSRFNVGLSVIPESLYDALKANPLPASEK